MTVVLLNVLVWTIAAGLWAAMGAMWRRWRSEDRLRRRDRTDLRDAYRKAKPRP